MISHNYCIMYFDCMINSYYNYVCKCVKHLMEAQFFGRRAAESKKKTPSFKRICLSSLLRPIPTFISKESVGIKITINACNGGVTASRTCPFFDPSAREFLARHPDAWILLRYC